MPTNFNSIKVQLEHGGVVVLSGSNWVFQFHKGTIRTRLQDSIFDLSVGNFNSIKVQLEQN